MAKGIDQLHFQIIPSTVVTHAVLLEVHIEFNHNCVQDIIQTVTRRTS